MGAGIQTLSLSFASIIRKDIKLVFSHGSGIFQPILLGMILVFVFSLSSPPGHEISARAAVAIFWLATSFALILVFNTLYSLEETNQARTALLLSPLPLQHIWLGKAITGMVLLLLNQAVFFPAMVVFLGQESIRDPVLFLAVIILVDWGLVAMGSLLGAVSQGHAARDSLLSVVIFPLLIPLLLAGIRLGETFMGTEADQDFSSWLGIAFAFGGIFSGAAMLLFPFLYKEY
ncbi:MAG: heme exporter protein CcmB [Desulfonatronovibrionaceae bacterium]